MVDGRQNIAIAGPEAVAGRHREVLTAVASAFAANGYHGVGMRAIAASLGLNQGTLYHYFKSKDHALLDVCLVGQQRVHANLDRAMAISLRFDDRLAALFAAHLEALREIPPFIQTYMSLHPLVPAQIDEPLRLALAHYWAKLRLLFEEAQQAGEVDRSLDPRDGVRLINGMMHELNLLSWAGRDGELAQFAKAASAVLVRGAKPPFTAND